ncbi:cyclohexanecarboxylate-CoA ligase [Alicyclobacillus contaminans]|uniref:class I adenylate-forming enzyme family protein n=1 Tax=Alicyclobacillus contaminans TaxID=392016 RepID=UPI000406B3C8|nr:class I adenylate-forming enzyme family protein [Alicyclobacillus contaminans]GMA50789.1 cyclohexanecarboxylate-CoA ligase [Alicyclobacillus contaminans]
MIEFAGRTLSLERAQRYLEEGVWTQESFVDVLQKTAETWPDLIHRDEERTLTYRQLWQEVEALAAHLYELGIRKGDRVAIQLPNTLDHVVAVFGIARIGAIGVSLQIDLGRQALVGSLNQAQAKLWILSENYRGQPLYENAKSLLQDVPSVQKLILQGDYAKPRPDTLSFTDLRSGHAALSEDILQAQRPEPLDAFLMVFTSGTTGSPKGVVHLHANYLWAARAYAKNFGYEPGQGVLDLAPIYHQTGMLAGIMMTVASGGRILLLDRFSAARVLKWVAQERPTYLVGAPPHVIHVANAPALATTDTSSVKLFIYAGAPVPSAVLQRLQTDGGMKVGCMFGWSEGLVATITRPDDPLEVLSTTVGAAVPGIEIRLVDEEGNDVPDGTPGEMWSRGPNFGAGYFENPVVASRQWDAEGWFHSGDLLRRDENGRYTFIARADDVINRGGTKIDPKRVEDVVAAYPGVSMVAVVGAPDPTLGQRSVACIVLQDGAEPFTLDQLREHLAAHGLAKFEFPDRLEFMAELPTTASGKIKKKALRDHFQREAVAE